MNQSKAKSAHVGMKLTWLKKMTFKSIDPLMKKLFFTCLVVLLATSCRIGYIPNAVNSPMLSQEGEIQVASHIGTSGFNLQGAYGLKDKIGIMVNANYLDNQADAYSTAYRRVLFGEIGGGYTVYRADRFQFDVYAGVGGGSISTGYTDDTYYNIDGFNVRGFIQPSAGLVGKYFEFTFTPRLTYVQLHNNLLTTSAFSQQFFIEPLGVLKAGPKYVKFVGQLGFNIPLQGTAAFDYQLISSTVGIQFTLGRKDD